MKSSDPQPSIMVVDDTPANLQLLETMLHEAGYRVQVFPDGKLALQAMERTAPDLVLLDVMMPEMNGFEVCRKMKAGAALREIPVLFLSALSTPEDKVAAFEAGGVDYVTKPFHEREVLARVGAQIRIVQLRQQLREHNAHLEELVGERTQALRVANERIAGLARVKGDFLRMISHEIRTPANGILAVTELLLDHDKEGDLRQAFEESSQRLHDLIDDAAMIARLEDTTTLCPPGFPLSDFLDTLTEGPDELAIAVNQQLDPSHILLAVRPDFVRRAMRTIIRLAACFSRGVPVLEVSRLGGKIRLLFALNALALTRAQAAEFFELRSGVRHSSHAEFLGLAPVAAERVLAACGGRLTLSSGEGQLGRLEAEIPCASDTPGEAGLSRFH